jgi:hypothetical protein
MTTEQNMDTRYKVGYFIGSLATASINRLLAKALVRLAPAELDMTEIPFKDLPLYSYDYDANYPPVASSPRSTTAPFLVRSRTRSTGQAGRMGQMRSRGNHRPLSERHQAKSARRSDSNTCAASSRSATRRK